MMPPTKLFGWRQWRSAWRRGCPTEGMPTEEQDGAPAEAHTGKQSAVLCEWGGALVTGTQQAGNPEASRVRQTSLTEGGHVFSRSTAACHNARHHLPTTTLSAQSGHCPTGIGMAGQTCSAAVQIITSRVGGTPTPSHGCASPDSQHSVRHQHQVGWLPLDRPAKAHIVLPVNLYQVGNAGAQHLKAQDGCREDEGQEIAVVSLQTRWDMQVRVIAVHICGLEPGGVSDWDLMVRQGGSRLAGQEGLNLRQRQTGCLKNVETSTWAQS